MSTLRFTRVVAALTAFALVSAAGAARADDDLESLLQQNVVSTASKTTEVANDAPATMSVLTADDIRRYGIRSLDEAIDFLGMGLVTQSPLHSVEIGGRGVHITADYGNHVVLIVDGHVMNEAWNQTAYFEQGAGIPIEIIDRVEIMLGPGSLLYGSNAMLATVNVVTKRAARYAGVRMIAEGTLSPPQSGGRVTGVAPADLGSSYRVGAGAGHELTLLGKRLELTAHVERYYQAGPPFTFAPQRATLEDGAPKSFGPRAAGPGIWGGTVRDEYFTDVTSGYAKVVVGDFTFMTRAASYKRGIPTIDFNKSVGNFDDARSRERDRWLSFDVRYDRLITSKLRLDLHATADSYDYYWINYSDAGVDCNIATVGPCRSTLPGVARWLGLDGHVAYDWLGDDRLTTVAGAWTQARYVGNKTDSYDRASGQELGSTGAVEGYEVPWAVFGQQRWSPARFVHLNGGARFDRAPSGASALSPRGAVSFDVWRGGSLKGIYAEAFRAPSFYEYAFEWSGQRAAPDLRPEKERSVEASLEQRLGRHTLFFGVFRTWWKDLIITGETADGLFQYQNVGAIQNYGYNARAEGSRGRFRYGLSVTGAHSHAAEAGEEHHLPTAPQVFGNGRVSYELGGDLPTVALAVKVIGPRLVDQAPDGSWAMLPRVPASAQLKLTFTGDIGAVKGLSYRVGADYNTAKSAPYVIGPAPYADLAPGARPPLAPVNRFTLFSGLQYEL